MFATPAAPRARRPPAGDMNAMSKGVTYAGLAYLAFAVIAMLCWVKGIMKVRSDFQPVQ